ncbi:hypothetical protein H8958_001049 [Nasalis larvatus]
MRRGVLMTLLQQSAMTLPLWIGKPGDKPPPLCGAIPGSWDYVARPGDKVAARVKAVDGDEQWILAEVVSYSHATNKYEVDDIDEEGRREQLIMALYPQTICYYHALIHTPPQQLMGPASSPPSSTLAPKATDPLPTLAALASPKSAAFLLQPQENQL